MEKIKIYIAFSTIFTPKIVPFMRCRGWGHAWRDQRGQNNTAHALCMLDKRGYRQTLRIFNTYCFSTATMLTRRRLMFLI